MTNTPITAGNKSPADTKKARIISVMTVAIFAMTVFALSVVLIVKPSDTFSDRERRNLEQFPEFTWESFIDGDMNRKINTFLNDQFPFRDFFVNLKCSAEKLLLKRENNGVLFGDNGQLAIRTFKADDGITHVMPDGSQYNPPEVDYFYKNAVSAEFAQFSDAASILREAGVPFSVILPPRTIDVAASAFSYPSENSDKLIECIRDCAAASGINFIDMYDTYRTRYDNGEYVYYKTDHHWTTLGAYYAYCEVMKSFGIEPYSADEFEIHTATDSFYGTAYSRAGNASVAPDVIEYWAHTELPPESFTTTVYDGDIRQFRSFDGFYDNSYVGTYDQYGMFLSGTNQITYVTKNGDSERETLLLLKDSFGLSLAPFLALHFDLVIVTFQEFTAALNKLSADDLPTDRVLLCYNLENIIVAANKATQIKYVARAFTE